MSEYCFFTTDSQALAESVGLKEKLETFAEQYKKQMYVLCKPLSKEDSTYDYDKAFIIFGSGSCPCVVDIGDSEDELDDFASDFFDDISFLSEKYKYKEKIGRKKHWVSLFKTVNHKDLDLNELILNNPQDKRVSDLLTSLVIGSINDISRINLEADNLLDVVKSKIILFDTDQTEFVFKMNGAKKFVIQGLAGSGKTELLLHKLKEIYSGEQDVRIAFTCFNKILASSMRSRIPEFFDFMKVEKQIDWDNKIFCFNSWGQGRIPTSGMYRYICHKYDVAFGNLYSGTFETLCNKAVADIKSIHGGNVEHIFDYVFIDESQDFGPGFIELCELVTKHKVFIAGDVFQNIFRPIDDQASHADLVLKKCYRTDPKNLMFSHALGMGLYEKPVLRWLKDHEWAACGYNYKEEAGRVVISRDPLKRFEDIPDDFESTSIHVLNHGEQISEKIFEVVNAISNKHKTLQPGDIAVIFVDKSDYVYDVIPKLRNVISDRLGWEVNVSHESKVSDPNKFFISNINNAKGLEFPFVICVAWDLTRSTSFRNGLYTMMARSFLESHLVLGSSVDINLLADLNSGLDCINKNGYMNLRIPSDEEKANQKDLIVWDDTPKLEERIREYCKELGANPLLTGRLVYRVSNMIGDDEFDDDDLKQLVDFEFRRAQK
ncbi:DEAD/DEAH box helicase [Shewanella algae]|nr:DEAD/DEAH box helicase [Shewanella algae]